MDRRAMNAGVIEQFRAGGEMNGMPRHMMLLLTTTGRRTGAEHTTPMMFVRLDDRLYVVASNSGAQRHPDWYLNILAEPRVRVEIGDRAYDAEAHAVSPQERAGLWPRVVERVPMYAQHQASTDREIPLVELIEAAD